MFSSICYILSIIIFINGGLIFLMLKHRISNRAVFIVALIGLMFIDLLSLLAAMYIYFN